MSYSLARDVYSRNPVRREVSVRRSAPVAIGTAINVVAQAITPRISRCGLLRCVCLCHDTDNLPAGMVRECNDEACSRWT